MRLQEKFLVQANLGGYASDAVTGGQNLPMQLHRPIFAFGRFNLTLAARGLKELFSSCAVVSVFGSGGK
jgi:hypothetical protein